MLAIFNVLRSNAKMCVYLGIKYCIYTKNTSGK
jgi:hypothetical protein